ncbi:bifunctional riboflavin kinase/FAD synthetase [Phormidium sp. FACHB-592]|uniref:Riboflavin biosynthesis protein n=1 Tax=Stenomitos frigidus AS-A4 TaxID=2933935 RepID=A0ABV0KGH8_9CYAN|nr:bifunctional riboflavin kinase/FAD synthetase [Phormidium sp. FACHB-592]
MWVTSSPTTVLTPTAVALGNFDGVHQGHRQVIQPVLPEPVTVDKGAHPYATVVTFHPHPQEFFTGQPRLLLTPLTEKAAQLSTLGVKQLVLLPFDRALASLNPEQFFEQVLVQQLKAVQVSIGSDFCFGQQRSGTAKDLQAIAARYGIAVTIMSLKHLGDERVSSSAIRQALQEGNLPYANQLLGRPYRLIGKVTQGQQLGRTLGFPTANLQLPPDKFLPRLGSYAVRVHVCDHDHAVDLSAVPSLPGVMNIGYRPTVNGKTQTIEVHLLDWAGDLYEQTLIVHLEAFLRSEQSFPSLDALKAQIQADSDRARTLLNATS